MDDDRPLQEAREALTHSDESPPPSGGGTPPPSKNNSSLIMGGIIVIVLLLIGAVFFLPPFSLGERLGLIGGDDAAMTEDEGGETETGAEAAASLPGQIETTAAGVGIAAVTAAELGAANVVPAGYTLAEPVFQLSYEGAAPSGVTSITVPTAAGAAAQADLFGWDGSAWHFVPSTVNGNELVTEAGPVSMAYAVMAASPSAMRSVGAELLPTQQLSGDVLSTLTELNVGTLTLLSDGTVSGSPATAPDGAFARFIRVTNTGVFVDTAALQLLLSDSTVQTQHIGSVVGQVSAGGFAGLNLDYQGVDPSQADAFANFVNELATALHSQGFQLAVTVSGVQQADGSWDTGGQNWGAIGQAADIVYLDMPLDPTAYGDGGAADMLVQLATRHISRQKLSLQLTANAVDMVEGAFRELSNGEAIASFGDLTFAAGGEEIEPGTPVEISMTGLTSQLEWDLDSVAYRYGYTVAEQAHTVWLSNAAQLAHHMRFASSYNLRGVNVTGIPSLDEGAVYAGALNSYLGNGDSPQPLPAGIVWTVSDEAGVVTSSPADGLTYSWADTNNVGAYTVRADFAQGDVVAELGSVSVNVVDPNAVAEVEQEAADTEDEAAADDDSGNTDEEAAAPPPATGTGTGDATVNVGANVRTGPGLSYGTVAGGAEAGTQVSIIGRNSSSSWIQVVLPSGNEGWIFADLLTINGGFDVSAVAVVEVDPPPTSSTDPGGGGGGTAPPPPAPIAAGIFELGGQTHTLASPGLMNYAGMTWVKFQHKWGSGDQPNAVQGRIDQARANGFKILLSMPGANTYPSSIDFAGYVTFVGGVAALGPDAIEVWNEMNIDFEWPAGQINPTQYVTEMLAPAYQAIKAANPNVMVISGAPAPTGFDNGTNAWSDQRYMNGVAAAGGANYMDCVGVHYNEGILPPSQTSGDPRVPSDFYSRYFYGMVNVYYNAFGGSRPLCFTELGYLSGDGFPGLPANFSWAASTSVAEHAQWLAEAASLSASNGNIRMMIVFNVDFNYYDPNGDPQAGFAMVRPDGSCPACDTLNAVTGGR